MPKKKIGGLETKARLELEWERVVEADDRPTVKEFCKRVGISQSTLYHLYPDWAKKIAMRRDQDRESPRRLSPVTKKQPKLQRNISAEITVEKLRKQLLVMESELSALNKDRDRWMREAKEAQFLRDQNERLRGVIQQYGRIIKKHVDTSKSQQIFAEISKVQERHLSIGK